MGLWQRWFPVIACAAGALSGVRSAGAVPPATFQPRQSRPVNGDALWTACADFNGDGRIDVAVGSNGSRQITTFYTQVDGTLPLTGSTTATTGVPTRLSAGDFNNDGRADLIYLDDNSGMKLTYGQPGNTFGGTTPISFANSASFWGRTAVGDLNHDGRLDAMIAYATSTSATGRVVTAYALAGGGFSASSFGTNSNPYGITNADLNGDGYLDIILGDNGGGIIVAYGSGSGTFVLKSFAYGDRGYGVVARDFNRDGIPDVAAPAWNRSAIGVMLTQANGDLGPASFFSAASTGDDIATGDFNGDGLADLVDCSQNSNDLAVLLGNGDGTFGSRVTLFASANGTSTVSIADLDHNGYDDIVVAAASGQKLDIFYAIPEPAPLTLLGAAALKPLTRRRRWN
jgi:hypothetical protein